MCGDPAPFRYICVLTYLLTQGENYDMLYLATYLVAVTLFCIVKSALPGFNGMFLLCLLTD